MTDFSAHQFGIYLGFRDEARPEFPLTYEGLRDRARELLSEGAYNYVAGSAGTEDTARENLDAFRRWRILPRMLTDVGTRDLSVDLFGTRIPAPLLLAPIGVQSIVDRGAEPAAARAAASLGLPFVHSTAASTSIEDLAAASGDGPRWYQLYWPSDPELTASLLQRAERAGYGAVVVTLDTRQLAWRPRDLSNAYLPFLGTEGLANYLTDPVFRASLAEPPERAPDAAVLRWASILSDLAHTWDDLASLKDHTSLPLLVKGVLRADDARRALDAGADGVVVSNHGGRQVDGAIGALDALPGVVEAVGGAAPVLFDSGIRSGADVFKALALGARAVLLGRPYIWGLAVGGERGVRHVLQCLLAELDLTMSLSGCASLAAVDGSMLARSPGS